MVKHLGLVGQLHKLRTARADALPKRETVLDPLKRNFPHSEFFDVKEEVERDLSLWNEGYFDLPEGRFPSARLYQAFEDRLTHTVQSRSRVLGPGYLTNIKAIHRCLALARDLVSSSDSLNDDGLARLFKLISTDSFRDIPIELARVHIQFERLYEGMSLNPKTAGFDPFYFYLESLDSDMEVIFMKQAKFDELMNIWTSMPCVYESRGICPGHLAWSDVGGKKRTLVEAVTYDTFDLYRDHWNGM